MSAPAVLMQLQALADPDYRAFHCRLIPTVPPERVLGVRTPALRRYARQLAGTPQAEDFLKALPHRYYDENNLHAFLRCGLWRRWMGFSPLWTTGPPAI